MQAAIYTIRERGYTIKAQGDKLIILPPPGGEFEADVYPLIEGIKAAKADALRLLNGFSEVPPASGDYHEITFPASDEAQMKRWAMAARRGLIHLTGPVQLSRATGQCRIAFRCNQPLGWLQDDITRVCKQEYNRVLARIEKGTT